MAAAAAAAAAAVITNAAITNAAIATANADAQTNQAKVVRLESKLLRLSSKLGFCRLVLIHETDQQQLTNEFDYRDALCSFVAAVRPPNWTGPPGAVGWQVIQTGAAQVLTNVDNFWASVIVRCSALVAAHPTRATLFAALQPHMLLNSQVTVVAKHFLRIVGNSTVSAESCISALRPLASVII
jgi:hypothetical protein